MNRIEKIQMLNALLEGNIKSDKRRAVLEAQLEELQTYHPIPKHDYPMKVQLGNDTLKTVVEDDDAVFWAEYAIEVLGQKRNTVNIVGV